MTDDEILRYTQHVARSQRALAKPLPAIVDFIAGAMCQHGIEPNESRIEIYLRRPAVQLLLRNLYEVGAWRAANGEFRLVALDLNPSPDAARRRLAVKHPGGNACAFCRTDEGAHAPMELRPEFNRLGVPYPGSRVHRACAQAMMQLRELAAQAQESAA